MGRAYLYHGGASMDATEDLIMTGEATGNQFGYSVASAWDAYGHGGEKEREVHSRAMAMLECVLEDRRAWASSPAA
jgi:hypothetical protein